MKKDAVLFFQKMDGFRTAQFTGLLVYLSDTGTEADEAEEWRAGRKFILLQNQ